jgi:MOSC domain-containing protein YiiM
VVQVTPVAHNGCKKWVQRFGLSPMQMNLDPAFRPLHLRGIYLRVVQDGRVRLGDSAVVLERAEPVLR